MEQCKFTIITPTLLRSSLTRACLSVSNQSYSNWEHIVVIDKPGTDIEQFLSLNPDLVHPNRKWFVCPLRHNNVGNSCRSSMFENISWDTNYVLYLDDDNYYMKDALSILNESVQALPNWGVFPITRFNEIFLNDPPGKNLTDVGQIFHKPQVGGQQIRYMNRNEYNTDGLMVEWLKTLSDPLVINCAPLLTMDTRGYGSAIPDSGKDPYTIVTLNKYDDVISPLLESIATYESRKPQLTIVADGHDRSYGYDLVRTDFPKFIFGRSANIGIKRSSPNDVILINDDVRLLSSDTFKGLHDIAYQHHEVGILSPLIDGGCGNVYMQAARTSDLWASNPGINGSVLYRGGTGFDYVSFVCVYLKRSMLDQIGLMDEGFSDYGRDDADMCIRAVRAGWKIAITNKLTVRHGLGGEDFNRGKNWNTSFSRQGILDAKNEYFYKKYPDEPRIPLWPQPHGLVPEQFKKIKRVFIQSEIAKVNSNFKQSMRLR